MTAGDVLSSSGLHPDRPIDYPPTREMLYDAMVIAQRCTQLLQSYSSSKPTVEGEPAVRSGYRPPDINAATPGAAQYSQHMFCRAVDLDDPHGELAAWCLGNLDLLEHFELYMEDPRWTPSWVHLQSLPPKSNSRVFIPFKGPPP